MKHKSVSRRLAFVLLPALAVPLLAGACPPDTFVHAQDFRLGDYVGAQAQDKFGEHVATDGRLLAVGAPRIERDGFTGGTVYLFERGATPGAWTFLKRLGEPNFAEGGDLFGSALAMSDDILVVGAFEGGDNGPNDAGLIDIFERDRGGMNHWGLLQEIVAREQDGNASFGRALAIYRGGQHMALLVSDPQADGNHGQVYVYERDGAQAFTLTATIDNPDSTTTGHFGDAISIHADTAVVSDPHFDANPSRAGSEGRVYVFARNRGGPNHWGLQTSLATTPADNDGLGTSVSISHDRIAVGTGVPAAGQVYLFARNQGGANHWGQIQRITAPAADAGASDGFGWSIDLHKRELLVGAYAVTGVQFSTGAAYVYQRVPQSNPETWALLQKFYSASNNYRSNFAVAMDWGHGFAVVGDPRSDDPAFPDGSKAGRAYVFFDDEIMCTPFE